MSSMLASAGLWIAVGALGAIVLAGGAGLFLLLAMGRLSLDLGWGRSIHRLGPITARIDAPRPLVFELISAPYLGRASAGPGIEVLAQSESMAVAAHYTKVHFYTSRTVEIVEFEPPGRIGFRHLAGPVPHAVESFELSEEDGTTELRYEGEVGIDFFLFGKLAGRHWVRPQWERAVREHLDELQVSAEERAERRSRRGHE